jgi:carbon monoxide dehydrogenase subunit G
MELQAFIVPVPVDRAWDALLDPQRNAPCMPGASFESVEGDAFTGTSGSSRVRSTRPIAARLAASPTPRTYVIGTGPSSSGPATE